MTMKASDLTGTWVLQTAYFQFQDNGERVDLYGPKPIGVVTFTSEGRLIAIVSSGAATGDDASKAMAAMAYSGKIEVSGETLNTLVDVTTIPEWIGSRQPRTMQLDDGVLTLRTPEWPSPRFGNRLGQGTLTWRREA